MINIVGANIKKLRKEHGMTQAELAKAVGLDRSSISKIESGQTDMHSSLLYKFGEVLGASIIDFYNDSDFAKSAEYIPYINKADAGTLEAVRKLLDMPALKNK